MRYLFQYLMLLLLLLKGSNSLSQTSPPFSLYEAGKTLPLLTGKRDKQDFLYVTAGQRLYAIGDQAGRFPETGFHVQGEMGGIWQHPIKLMDGFRARLLFQNTTATTKEIALDKADHFTAYPFMSGHVYRPNATLSVTRTQFVPDEMPLLVVEYYFQNKDSKEQCFTMEVLADADLSPVWLGDQSGMKDGQDQVLPFQPAQNIIYFKDENNTWFAGIAADKPVQFARTEKLPSKGKGITGILHTTVRVPAKGSSVLHLYIAGSMVNTAEIDRNIATGKRQLPVLYRQKQQRYRQMAHTAAITIPDKALQQAYEWGRYSSDWLIREVPGLGRGMSAGLPDYPWFFSNDQAYTFNALTGLIKPGLFYQSWRMIKALSDKANQHSGRIIHEASTSGAVYDKGRMEESQVHIIAAWNIFRWTGNLSFLKENYVYGKKIYEWLMQHDTDRDLYVEGYGGVEIEGLNDEMLDVAVDTQEFFRVMSEMGAVLGDTTVAADFAQKADTLQAKINRDWWLNSENRYADFIAGKDKALQIIADALLKRVHAGRNEWAKQKLESLRAAIVNNQYPYPGYVVYYNTSGLLPVKAGIADTVKARQLLQHISFFTNRFGAYISGIERPDDTSIDEGSFAERRADTGFNYNQAVMPAATASLAIAECRYGSPDTALQYIHRILASFGYATPGTTYEVSPDFGMFVQAWNITGINIPLIRYFFGIDPDAWHKRVYVHPAFPSQWNEADLQRLLIGDNMVSMHYEQKNGRPVFQLKCTRPGWQIHFAVPGAMAAWVNGKPAKVQAGAVIMTGRWNTIELRP